MNKLTEEIIQFFQQQGFVIVSSVDKSGSVHNSCKGIADIDKKGNVYLLDLYSGRTLENLKNNSNVSLTAVDENRFRGYCLKGKAKKIQMDHLNADTVKKWEEKVTSRITNRVIKSIQGDKGHVKHPEVLLPKPEYLIVVEVNETVDLTPMSLR